MKISLSKKNLIQYINTMKKSIIKLSVWSTIVLIIFTGIIIFIDSIFMPLMVSVPEVEVPNIVGKSRSQAIDILIDQDLIPIKQGEKYDEKIPKDMVVMQKPEAGKSVKEGRHIYYWVSSGELQVKVPNIIGRTLRDASITLERLQFKVGEIVQTESELPSNTVLSQAYHPGVMIKKGSRIDIEISVGPSLGMVRVPGLIAKSYREAESILKSSNLSVGEISYQKSSKLLPNTVIDQNPSEDALLNSGDPVNLVITK